MQSTTKQPAPRRDERTGTVLFGTRYEVADAGETSPQGERLVMFLDKAARSGGQVATLPDGSKTMMRAEFVWVGRAAGFATAENAKYREAGTGGHFYRLAGAGSCECKGATKGNAVCYHRLCAAGAALLWPPKPADRSALGGWLGGDPRRGTAEGGTHAR